MLRCICPVCLHERTMRDRLGGYEPCYDDMEMMYWQRPHGGAKGQQVTPYDGGYWKCERCWTTLSPEAAGTLLDAALMHIDPECDSIREGIHEDARIAFKGGPA